MLKQNIRKTISITHSIIALYFILFPFITPLIYLKNVVLFFLGVVIHWYFLKGRCWMSILEDMFKEKNEPETRVFGFFEKYNFPIYTFDIFMHINFIFAYYRLNIIISGMFVQSLFLMINKFLYGKLYFKP